jgi:hypothetical protein
MGLACIFGMYAYVETRWRNAAIEKWKFGLPGTGNQNPRAGADLFFKVCGFSSALRLLVSRA